MTNKEEAYNALQRALHSCTEEDSDRVAVVVLIDNKADTVRVYGLNIDAEEVPQMLVDVAQEVYDKAAMAYAAHRTLN
jgi:hypothetical protein